MGGRFLVAMAVAAGAVSFAACGNVLEIDDGAARDGGDDGTARDGGDDGGTVASDAALEGSALDAAAACSGDAGTNSQDCAPGEVATGSRNCNTFTTVTSTATTTLDEAVFVSSPASLLVNVDEISKTGTAVDSFEPFIFDNATTEADVQLVAAAERADVASISISVPETAETQIFYLEAAPDGALSVSTGARAGTPRTTRKPAGALCLGSFTHVRMRVRFPAVDDGTVRVIVTVAGTSPIVRSFPTTLTADGGGGLQKTTLFSLGLSVPGATVGKSIARFDNWSTHIY